MLKLDQIDAYYGDLQALWGISLEVREGEFVALVGPNGAGKTTTLKVITGLLKPKAGNLQFGDRRLNTERAHKIVESGISLVPEGGSVFTAMSVLENLEVGAFTGKARSSKDESLKRVFQIFPRLEERKRQRAGTLSGGERQMLAIGRALMSKPKLLLLDEPSFGLAPILVQNMFEMIAEINRQGVTVLLVEQNIRVALELATSAYIIENGRIVGHGTGDDLLSFEFVRSAYLAAREYPMLEPLVQNLVFGVLVGALYGLAAVGLSLVFGVTKILNVAHGELLMFGGYASFWAVTLLGIDPFLSLVPAVMFLAVIGYILYKLIFSRLVKLDESVKIQNTLLVGFGLSLILQNIALRLWSADTRGITTFYSGWAVTSFGIRFPVVRVASLVIALVTLLALELFLRRTYTGKALRATVENWEAATLMGIDIQKVYMLAFVMGASLAAIAGTLVSVGYSIDPMMGLNWTLTSLIVMVLGGLGSIIGTFVGGIVLGVTQSATGFFLSQSYREVVGLVLFLLVLVFRPQGLFGAKER